MAPSLAAVHATFESLPPDRLLRLVLVLLVLVLLLFLG
jgi:hypothetical protein